MLRLCCLLVGFLAISRGDEILGGCRLDRKSISQILVVNCSGGVVPSVAALSVVDEPFFLDVSDTRLRSIAGNLTHLHWLRGLRLDRNPLVCDCNLRQLMQKRNLSVQGDCRWPEPSKPVASLSLHDFICGPLLIAQPATRVSVSDGGLVKLTCIILNGSNISNLRWIHSRTQVALHQGWTSNFTYKAHYNDGRSHVMRCMGQSGDVNLASNDVTIMVKKPRCHSSCSTCEGPAGNECKRCQNGFLATGRYCSACVSSSPSTKRVFTSAGAQLPGRSGRWNQAKRRLVFDSLEPKQNYFISSDIYEFIVKNVTILARKKSDNSSLVLGHAVAMASSSGQIVINFSDDNPKPEVVQLACVSLSEVESPSEGSNWTYATWYGIDLSQLRPTGHVSMFLSDETGQAKAHIQIGIGEWNGSSQELVTFKVIISDADEDIFPIRLSVSTTRSLLPNPIDFRLSFSKPDFSSEHDSRQLSQWRAQPQIRPTHGRIGNWTALKTFSPLEVGPSAKYQTLQAAVNEAYPGSLILVYPGQYGTLTEIRKPLHVISAEGSSQTIITATVSVSDEVLLDGFTFYASFYRHGIEISGNKPVHVVNSMFDGPYKRLGVRESAAIALFTEARSLKISNCLFRLWHKAIDLTGRSSDVVLRDNVFEENDRALMVDGAVNLTVMYNVFESNDFAFDLSDELGYSRNVRINWNVFMDNGKTLRHLFWPTSQGGVGSQLERIDARRNFWGSKNVSTATLYWSDGDVYPGPDMMQGFLIDPVLDAKPLPIPFPHLKYMTTSVECDGRWTAGKWWTVRPDALQYAVLVAPEGSTLQLQAGTYRQDVLVLRKALSLVGISGRTDFYGRIVVETSSSVLIRGISIHVLSGPAIVLKGQRGRLDVEECSLSAGRRHELGGDNTSAAIDVESESVESSVTLCSVYLYGWWNGIRSVAPAVAMVIRQSQIEGCHVAINVSAVSHVQFIRNRVKDCQGGIVLQNGTQLELIENTFLQVNITLSYRFAEEGTFGRLEAANNYWSPEKTIEVVVFSFNSSSDYELTAELLNRLKESKVEFLPVTSSPCGNGTSSAGLYPVDFQTIGDAVSVASNWDTVLVLDGDYSEETVNISKSIRLIGRGKPVVRAQLSVEHGNCLIAGLALRCPGNCSNSLITIRDSVSRTTLQDLNVVTYGNSDAAAVDIKGGSGTGNKVVSSKFVSSTVAIRLHSTEGRVFIEGNTFVECKVAVDVIKVRSLTMLGNHFHQNVHLTFSFDSEPNERDYAIKHNNFGHGAELELVSQPHSGTVLLAEKNFWADRVYGLQKFDGVKIRPFLMRSVDVKEFASKAKSCVRTSGLNTLDNCKALPLLPSESLYPDILILTPDASVELIAEAEVGRQFASFQWFQNGDPLEGEVNRTLYISSVGNETEKIYTYTVETEAGRITSRKMNLVAKSCWFDCPAFTSLLEFNVVVEEDSDVSLKCPVCSEALLNSTLTWYKDEQPVWTSENGSNGDFLLRASQADEGRYHCEVVNSNTEERIVSNRMSLTVEGQPTFASDRIEIEVNATSSPGTAIGNPLIAVDSDLEQVVRYSIIGGSGRSWISIDVRTGQLFMVTSDMFLASESRFNLTVAAVDNSLAKRRSSVLVFLTKKMVNEFIGENGHYEVNVREGENFTIVVKAIGKDRLPRGRHINYRLATHTQRFTVNSSGHFRNVAPFDYEADPHLFNVTIVAEDENGLAATMFVVVTVVDVNDNSPAFTQDSYDWRIPESLAKGSKVGRVSATDADGTAQYGTINSYKFSQNSTFFAVNSLNGDVVIAGSLDYDAGMRFFSLGVVARDGDGREGSAIVRVDVTNTNDNRPRFSKSVVVLEINENSWPPSRDGFPEHALTFVEAFDDDGDEVFYEAIVLSANFSVTRDGYVILQRPLDYEAATTYQIDIMASDGYWNASAPIAVAINVWNLNDNRPHFTNHTYFASVNENTVSKEPLVTLSVTDDDGDLNEFTFILHNDSAPVAVDEKGEIFLLEPLDYESRQSVELSVFVNDGSFTSNLAATVTIAVINLNDNRPVFEVRSYSVSIASDLSEYELEVVLMATDDDLDGEGEVRGSGIGPSVDMILPSRNIGDVVLYTIRENVTEFSVSVDPDTGFGIITNTVPISWRLYTFQNLTIDAYDGGGLMSSYPAVAEISRRHLPDIVFERSRYFFEVEENTVGSFLQVQVVDSASQMAWKDEFLRYGFLHDQSVLAINSSTGEVKTMGLDYEDGITNFNMTLTASVKSSLFATASLFVTLTDQNDNAPLFHQSRYGVTVPESISVGKRLLKVEAIDQDTSLKFKVVTYSIVNESRFPFSINATTGWITLKSILDYETQTHLYNVSVRAEDEGLLFSTATVSVNVTDVNDSPPCPSVRDYRIAVNRTIQPGSTLLAIQVIDLDGYTEKLRAVIDPPSSYFFVDDRLEVRLVDLPEKGGFYLFRIRLSDGNLSCPYDTMLNVTIAEPTVSPPEFEKANYTVEIKENVLPGDWSVILRASQEKNLPITYEMISGNRAIFSVRTDNATASGILSNTRALNAETDNLEYRFEVAAHVLGNVVSERLAFVTVKLLDENEFPPVIIDENTAHAKENDLDGLNLLLLATDADRDSSLGNVSFFLAKENNFVSVSKMSGLLRLKRALNYETDPNKFSVFVVAIDEGGLESSPSEVTVLVDDENELPIFSKPFYQSFVEEGAPAGVMRLQFTATDPDSGKNGELVLSVTSELLQIMSFDNTTGVGIVSNRIPLDFELDEMIVAQLIAADGGGLIRRTTVWTIVLNVNEYTPRFPNSKYTAKVKEGPSPKLVLTVEATDDDDGNYGTIVNYTINSSSPVPFFVSSRGELLSSRPLDYESGDRIFVFTVSAQDGGRRWTKRTDYATVEITVVNVNDNPPKPGVNPEKEDRPVPLRRAFVEWDRKPSDLPVFVLQASDEDPDDVIYYYIDEEKNVVDLPFAIPSPTNGRIILNRTIGDPPGTVYNFTVLVSDRPIDDKDDGLSFVWPITVRVEDTNDPPRFQEPTFREVRVENGALLESGPDGITKVTAIDDDYPGLASTVTSYDIVGGGGRFNISSSGVVTLSNRTSSELPPRMELEITATDGEGMTSLIPFRLTIVVWFRNNHFPVLITRTLNVSESWDTFGEPFGRLKASDDDVGSFGVVFSVSSFNSSLFNVSVNGDVFLLSSVDYEGNENPLTFSVTVTDSGEPAKSINSTVSVLILNDNDNRPSITITRNRFLYETAGARFDFAATALYQDPDGIFGWTHRLNVSLSPQIGPFSPFTSQNCQSGSSSPSTVLCIPGSVYLMSAQYVPKTRRSGPWGAVPFSGKAGEHVEIDVNEITGRNWRTFTLQLWVKIGDGGEGTIASLVVGNNYILFSLEIRRRKTDLYVAFQYRSRTVNKSDRQLNLGTVQSLGLNDGRWHQLTLISIKARTSFYVDGNRMVTRRKTTSRLFSSHFSLDRKFRIGAGLNADLRPLKGSLWGLTVSQSYVADQVDISCTLNCGEGLALPSPAPRLSLHYYPMGIIIEATSTLAIQKALRNVVFVRPHRPIRPDGEPREIVIVSSDGIYNVTLSVTLAPPNSNFFPPVFHILSKLPVLRNRKAFAVVAPSVAFSDEDKSKSTYSVVGQLDPTTCDRTTYDVPVALKKCDGATSAVDLLPRQLSWTRGLNQKQREGRSWFIFNRRSKTLPAGHLPSDFGTSFTFTFWVKILSDGVVFDKRDLASKSDPILSVSVGQRYLRLKVTVNSAIVNVDWVVLFRSERRHVAVVCQGLFVTLYVDGIFVSPRRRLHGFVLTNSRTGVVSLGGVHTDSETKRSREGIRGELSGIVLLPAVNLRQSTLQCLLRCMETVSVDRKGLPSAVKVTEDGSRTRMEAQVFPEVFRKVFAKILFSSHHPFPSEGTRRVDLSVRNGNFLVSRSVQVTIPKFDNRNITIQSGNEIETVSAKQRQNGFKLIGGGVDFVGDGLSTTVDLVRVELKRLPRITVPFTATAYECEIARTAEKRNAFCVGDDNMAHLLSSDLVDSKNLESIDHFEGVVLLKYGPPVAVINSVTTHILNQRVALAKNFAFATYVSVSREDTTGYLFACVFGDEIQFGLEVDSRDGTITFAYARTAGDVKERQAFSVFEATIDDGRWHHLVLNIQKRRASLYVDGRKVISHLQKYVHRTNTVRSIPSEFLLSDLDIRSQCTIYLGSDNSVLSRRRFIGRLWGLSILTGNVLSRTEMNCLRFLPADGQCIEHVDFRGNESLRAKLREKGISVSSSRFDVTFVGLADETFYREVLDSVEYTNSAAKVHPDYPRREISVYATDHGGRFESNKFSTLVDFDQ